MTSPAVNVNPATCRLVKGMPVRLVGCVVCVAVAVIWALTARVAFATAVNVAAATSSDATLTLPPTTAVNVLVLVRLAVALIGGISVASHEQLAVAVKVAAAVFNLITVALRLVVLVSAAAP